MEGTWLEGCKGGYVESNALTCSGDDKHVFVLK